MPEDGRGVQVEQDRYASVGPSDHVSQRTQRLMIHLRPGRANERPDGHDVRVDTLNGR